MDTLADCYPGQKLECINCSKKQTVNWGLDEPDHWSSVKSLEDCSHHICVWIYSGAAAKQKEESLKAAYKACAPSEEVIAVHKWMCEHDKDSPVAQR